MTTIANPKADRGLRNAIRVLSALNAMPIHREFHHACRVAVKDTASHSQQSASKKTANQVGSTLTLWKTLACTKDFHNQHLCRLGLDTGTWTFT
jgi:hypothetical protein